MPWLRSCGIPVAALCRTDWGGFLNVESTQALYIVTQATTNQEKGRTTVSLDCDTLYFKEVLSHVRSPDWDRTELCISTINSRCLVSLTYLDSAINVNVIREEFKFRNFRPQHISLFDIGSQHWGIDCPLGGMSEFVSEEMFGRRCR